MKIGDNRIDKFRIFYYVYNTEQNSDIIAT